MTSPSFSDLHERILAHPGKKYLDTLMTYSVSKNILAGNGIQLRKLLEYLEDPNRIPELWALDKREHLRNLHSEVVRHFHNFLASVRTLVDHTRVVMRSQSISEAHRAEYQKAVSKQFASDPLARFMQDLRNYMLHKTIPVTSFELAWQKDTDRTDSSVYVNLDKMADWQGWSLAGRIFIEANRPQIRMMTLVDNYEDKVRKFYEWFCPCFLEYYKKEIDGVTALQTAWNKGLSDDDKDNTK